MPSGSSRIRRAATPKKSSTREHEVGFMITRARRRLWRAATRRLETRGESVLEWAVLSQLARCGATSQRDLADAIAHDPAGVCRLLDTLETNGDVGRTRDAADRRRVLVSLTRRGRSRYEHMYPAVTSAIEEVLAPLTPGERRQLGTLLRKVLDE